MNHFAIHLKLIQHCKSTMCVCVCVLSCIQLFVAPWTVACQAPLYMEFSRQEYWSEVSFPNSGDLPNQGIEPVSPALQVDSLPSEPPTKPPKSTVFQ